MGLKVVIQVHECEVKKILEEAEVAEELDLKPEAEKVEKHEKKQGRKLSFLECGIILSLESVVGIHFKNFVSCVLFIVKGHGCVAFLRRNLVSLLPTPSWGLHSELDWIVGCLLGDVKSAVV